MYVRVQFCIVSSLQSAIVVILELICCANPPPLPPSLSLSLSLSSVSDDSMRAFESLTGHLKKFCTTAEKLK